MYIYVRSTYGAQLFAPCWNTMKWTMINLVAHVLLFVPPSIFQCTENWGKVQGVSQLFPCWLAARSKSLRWQTRLRGWRTLEYRPQSFAAVIKGLLKYRSWYLCVNVHWYLLVIGLSKHIASPTNRQKTFALSQVARLALEEQQSGSRVPFGSEGRRAEMRLSQGRLGGAATSFCEEKTGRAWGKNAALVHQT